MSVPEFCHATARDLKGGRSDMTAICIHRATDAMDLLIHGRRTKILLALILVMTSAILELYIEAIRVSRLAKINIVACSAQHFLDT